MVLLPLCFGARCSDAKTPAEIQSGYAYIPTEPIPLTIKGDTSCPLQSSLPDNAVRLSVQSIQAGGGITFGSSAISSKGSRYQTTFDYMNAATITQDLVIRQDKVKRAENLNRETQIAALEQEDANKLRSDGKRDTRRVQQVAENAVRIAELRKDMQEAWTVQPAASDDPDKVSITVFVGIGLRMFARIQTFEAGLNISGMGVVGAEASANALWGTVALQTLGINGPRIAAAIPVVSKLSVESVQNGMIALGSIKTLLYETDTVRHPRVLGFYLPFEGDEELVKKIISELSRTKVTWTRTCPPGSSSEQGDPSSG